MSEKINQDSTSVEENTQKALTGDQHSASDNKPPSSKENERGGPKGLEPTRYGDWERKGICVDF